MTWTYSLCCSLVGVLLSSASLRIAGILGHEPKFSEASGNSCGWGSVIGLFVRTKGIHDSLPASSSRCSPRLVELTPSYFSFLKPFSSTLTCNQINIKWLFGVPRICVTTFSGKWTNIFQLQKYVGLNSLMCCDYGCLPFQYLWQKRKRSSHTFMYLSHTYVLCTYTNIFIPMYLHKAQLITLWFPSQLTLSLCPSSLTGPVAMAFQLRTFLHIPLPRYGFKGQVVLPPVAFVPMTLSQTFTLAVSILLPLIAHWTWSWVNGLVLSRLENISFPLSKLNKNKEIKLNTKLCLNNSRAVTWSRKL